MQVEVKCECADYLNTDAKAVILRQHYLGVGFSALEQQPTIPLFYFWSKDCMNPEPNVGSHAQW